jgi:cytochrome c peroxidase
MNRSLYLILSFLALAVLTVGCGPARTPKEEAKALFLQDLDSLESLVNGPLLQLAQSGRNPDSIQQTFYRCRLAYKKIEHLTEYFYPTTSRLVNGPALPEYELEENKSFEPGGLQVIEEMIFPFDTSARTELVREVRKLQPELRRYRELWAATDFTETHLFEAVRLQLFRNITLGVSGFDTPICQTAIPELTTNLRALQRYVDLFAGEEHAELNRLFAQAIGFTEQHPDFDTFDRLTFIAEYINPLTSTLLDYQKQLGYAPFDELTALRTNARTLFDTSLFNADYYTGNALLFGSADKEALGRKLFYDPQLSANNARSCASCHQPDRAFTDGLVQSAGLRGTPVSRNVPTLYYAALQQRQFYDQRAVSLEAQSLDVIQNRDEMHGSLSEASVRLGRDSVYVRLFRRAFPDMDTIMPRHIMNALASYERTLMPFDSRFDAYMRGEKTLLGDAEKRGFNLFMGKAKCGICHFMPIFNGTVPPQFAKSESEVIGVLTAPGSGRIDPDAGKGAMYPTLPDLHGAFKTPTVRNVALTAPYMHNGAYRTLEEVVAFYNHGGAAGLGLSLPNQTLPADSLHLNSREQADLVSFLKALTDRSLLPLKSSQLTLK